MTNQSTFTSLSIFNIPEISIIGGTYKKLNFYVYDAAKNPIDISSFTFDWKMCPYGRPEIVSLSKTGVYDTTFLDKNRFYVEIFSTETISMSGKYVHQPIIKALTGFEFRMAQGYIIVLPAIGLS